MKTKTQIIHDECKEYGGFINVITKCGGTLVGHLWEHSMQEYADQQTKEKDDKIKSLGTSLLDVATKSSETIIELREEIERLKESKWISVEERLPTERVEFVLLFNADAPKYNQCVYQGTWFLQNDKFKSDTTHNLLGTVTHWQPLPNNPI